VFFIKCVFPYNAGHLLFHLSNERQPFPECYVCLFSEFFKLHPFSRSSVFPGTRAAVSPLSRAHCYAISAPLHLCRHYYIWRQPLLLRRAFVLLFSFIIYSLLLALCSRNQAITSLYFRLMSIEFPGPHKEIDCYLPSLAALLHSERISRDE
jgi:hypothetical protein